MGVVQRTDLIMRGELNWIGDGGMQVDGLG